MRSLIAVLLVIIAPALAAQRSVQVTNTNDEGAGSLRDALRQCNGSCTILFQIPVDENTRWLTIRPLSPLPPLGAILDGRNQTKVYGDTNPLGPEIEINGELAGPNATGLEIASGSVYGVTINGFSGPAIHATVFTMVDGSYIGCDPTASRTIPNERGIVLDGPKPVFGSSGYITNNIIAGNRRAGIFAWSGSDLHIDHNRIEWNGSAGIFMGPIVDGAFVTSNAVAFNGDAGIAIAAGPHEVELRTNSLHANANLGVDYVLDGVSPSVAGTSSPIHYPEITSARYDAATDTTIVEGFQRAPHDGFTTRSVAFYANDAPDPSGFGEGQYPLGDFFFASFDAPRDPQFRITLKGKPPGRWITATVTVGWHYYWSRNPGADGNNQGLRTTTTEFGPTVEIEAW